MQCLSSQLHFLFVIYVYVNALSSSHTKWFFTNCCSWLTAISMWLFAFGKHYIMFVSWILISHRKSYYFIDVGIWQPCIEPRIIHVMQQCRQWMVSSRNVGELRFGDPWIFWGFMLAGRHKAKEALVFGLNKLNLQSILNLFLDLGHLMKTEQIFCLIVNWTHQLWCKYKIGIKCIWGIIIWQHNSPFLSLKSHHTIFGLRWTKRGCDDVTTLCCRHEECDVIVRIKAAAISGQGLEPYVTICHELLQDLGRVQPRPTSAVMRRRGQLGAFNLII